MSKTFCPIPWIFQAFRSNGDIRVCCQSNNTPSNGIIRKKDKVAYNAKYDDLESSRNADLIKNMRLNMLAGIWSDECKRCQIEEQLGQYSRRMYENQIWDFNISKAIQHTSADGSIFDLPIKYYDLRFGNKCNLACRMCGPTDSDFWYSDWQKMYGNSFRDNGGDLVIIGKENTYDWYENTKFWQQLTENLENTEYIYFAGGEPTLIQKHYDFLETCIEKNYSNKITLEYNTNLTSLPPRLLQLWKNFKKVKVGASIDGFGDVFEYQRYPAKWSKVYDNIKKLDNTENNIECWFTYTVTVYNVLHTQDFINWVNNEKFNKFQTIKHHMAHYPPHMNIQILPLQYKKLIENVLDKNNPINDNIIKYINKEHSYALHWNTFKDYTLKLDKIRNQKIKNILPQLAEYIYE